MTGTGTEIVIGTETGIETETGTARETVIGTGIEIGTERETGTEIEVIGKERDMYHNPFIRTGCKRRDLVLRQSMNLVSDHLVMEMVTVELVHLDCTELLHCHLVNICIHHYW